MIGGYKVCKYQAELDQLSATTNELALSTFEKDQKEIANREWWKGLAEIFWIPGMAVYTLYACTICIIKTCCHTEEANRQGNTEPTLVINNMVNSSNSRSSTIQSSNVVQVIENNSVEQSITDNQVFDRMLKDFKKIELRVFSGKHRIAAPIIIEVIKKIHFNKEKILKLIDESQKNQIDKVTFFLKIATHPENDRRPLINSIDIVFLELYHAAKKENKLEEFFINTIDPDAICLEAICETILAWHSRKMGLDPDITLNILSTEHDTTQILSECMRVFKEIQSRKYVTDIYKGEVLTHGLFWDQTKRKVGYAEDFHKTYQTKERFIQFIYNENILPKGELSKDNIESQVDEFWKIYC